MDTPETAQDEAILELISLFATDPDTFVFRESVATQIHARRARMSDVLIFDILLTSGNVRNPSAFYPPSDVSELYQLLSAIEESSYDSLKKDCLVYFLLKWHRDDRAWHFQSMRSIPPQFVALADAYWALDCGVDVPRAISLLADARLNRDYTSKILQAISISSNPNPLIRKYIRTARPILSEAADIDMYAIALADSSLLEAWQYQQTFPEGGPRSRLIRKLLHWSLTPKPRPQPMKQLLGFPLSTYEQSLLHNFAIRPPSDLSATSITAIQDLTCLRLVLSGQVVAAVKLNRQFPTGATLESRRAAQERKQQMLDEAVALLPAAERRLLELDLERSSQNGDLAASVNSDMWGSAVDLSMSMSWEHISPPGAKPNGSAAKPARISDSFKQSPATPIPKRAGAPRFGGPISALSNSNSQSPSFVLGRTQPSPQLTAPPVASTSRVRSLAAKFQNPPPERPIESLYDTFGSANMQRNAFYEPPVSAGSKRPLPRDLLHPFSSSATSRGPADTSTASASAVVQELMREDEQDIEMNESGVEEPTEPDVESRHAPGPDMIPEMEAEGPGAKRESRANRSIVDMDREEDPRELTFSLFSSSVSAGPVKPPQPVSEAKLPPGAFYAEIEDDEDAEIAMPPPPPSRPRRSEAKQPAEQSISAGRKQLHAQTQEKPPTRSAKPRKSVKPQDLGRSLPGSLMDDEEEEEETEQVAEEEDTVPPLPPISSSSSRRQTTRKSRSSKGAETEREKREKDSARPTRRSSRLSVVSASSRGSSSPEPPASPVKRRSARTSVPTPKKKAATKQR